MDIVGIIPARYKSTRFPGKPLADICGKPMIVRVFENAKKVSDFSRVLVATDDKRIAQACERFGIEYIITKEDHKTGTDRIAEASKSIPADLYVNIQGDEPLLGLETIRAAIEPFKKVDNGISVTNLMAKIDNPSEIINTDVPKVVVNSENEAIFLSRLPVPYPKENRDISYFKQVCVYGILPEALERFGNLEQGTAEKAEGIELLRFIENGIKVKMILVENSSIAVDSPKDLERVNQIWKGA